MRSWCLGDPGRRRAIAAVGGIGESTAEEGGDDDFRGCIEPNGGNRTSA
jgi:hypothetical protein